MLLTCHSHAISIAINIRIRNCIITYTIIVNIFNIGSSLSCSSSINIEWLRLCRRPLLSTDAISYCVLVTSERCLEGGRDRNGARTDAVDTSY